MDLDFDTILTKVLTTFEQLGIERDNRFYAFSRAYAYLIQYRNAQLVTILDQQSIDKATGEWLDNIGKIRGLVRFTQETDEQYRVRLGTPQINVSVPGYYSRRLHEAFPADDIYYIKETNINPPNIVVYLCKHNKTAHTPVDIAKYQAYVQSDNVRLVNDNVTVQNLNFVTVNVTAVVTLKPFSTISQEGLVNIVNNWLDNQVIPGQDISTKKLIGLLAYPADVVDVNLTVPAANVVINDGEIAKRGTINITVN